MTALILILIFLLQFGVTILLVAHLERNEEILEHELLKRHIAEKVSYRRKVIEVLDGLLDEDESIPMRIGMFLIVTVLGIPAVFGWYFTQDYKNVGFGFFWPRKITGVSTRYDGREYNSGYGETREVFIKYPYIKIGCRIATIDRMKKIIVKEHGEHSLRAQAYLDIIKEYETGITQ
jgi:hypothetical protein